MIIMIKGMYIGRVDAKEYTVEELQNAGFTVVIE